MQATADISFTKLRSGDWGVRGPAEELQPQAVVNVPTQSRGVRTVRIAKVLWTDGEIAIATKVDVSLPPVEREGMARVRAQVRQDARVQADAEAMSGDALLALAREIDGRRGEDPGNRAERELAEREIADSRAVYGDIDEVAAEAREFIVQAISASAERTFALAVFDRLVGGFER